MLKIKVDSPIPDEIQGFLISIPVPAEEVAQMPISGATSAKPRPERTKGGPKLRA